MPYLKKPKHKLFVLFLAIPVFGGVIAGFFLHLLPPLLAFSLFSFLSLGLQFLVSGTAGCLAGALATFVGVFHLSGHGKADMIPGVTVLLGQWACLLVMSLHQEKFRGKEKLAGDEIDEMTKKARILKQEITFYEERQRELSKNSLQRKELSKAARELGSQLEPSGIQDHLIASAHRLFPGRFVQITVAQNPDPVDTFVIQRKQSLQVPTGQFKGNPLIAAPISAQGSVAGVIRIGGEPGGAPFTREDLRTLEVLASLASSSLDNTYLFAQVQENALRDNLTGLWTHKVFQDQLESEILQASRFQQKLSVILADVDHFKAVNDTHGHQAGDQVLTGFSKVLQSQVRDVDFVARYGGEEFVILLLDTSYEQALEVAEKIRVQLERQRFSTSGKVLTITSSFGVSTFPHDATSAQQLIRKADERLYQAKKAGRNRVFGRAA